MKRDTAMAIMTTKVRELVNNGWSIAFDLGGSYSNVKGYATFSNGDKRAIVYVEETSDYGREVGELRVKCAEITLGKGETLERNYIWPSQWDQHITEQHTFYKVAYGHGDWYGTKEEAEEAHRVRRARWKKDYIPRTRKDFRITEQVLRMAHGIKGFKTVRAEYLSVYRIDRVYYVENTKSGRIATYRI